MSTPFFNKSEYLFIYDYILADCGYRGVFVYIGWYNDISLCYFFVIIYILLFVNFRWLWLSGRIRKDRVRQRQ